MLASVVIPTCDRPEYLALALAGLARQTAAPDAFEIVVVNDGAISVDRPIQQFRDLNADVRVRVPAYQAKGNRAAARNRGAEVAAGDLLVFLDQDMIPAATFIETHRAAFTQGRDVIVGSKLARAYTVPHDLDDVDRAAVLRSGKSALVAVVSDLDFAGGPLLTTAEVASGSDRLDQLTLPLQDVYGLVDYGDLPWPKWPLCSGGNVAYSRNLFEAIDGFDEGFVRYGLEDGECAYRARTTGASFTYRQSAHATHQYHPRDRTTLLEDTIFSWRYFVAKHDAADVWLWLAWRVLGQMTFAQYAEVLRRYEAGDADARREVAERKEELRSVTPASVLALRSTPARLRP